MKKIKFTELFIFIVLAELVGILSSLFSGDFSSQYTNMTKPPFSPPGIVFPVVWVILYAVMGISAYMVYASENLSSSKGNPLKIYFIQLFFNFCWSILFFGFNLPVAAFIDIVLLIFAVVLMVVMFYKVSKIAGLLNIPYLLWLLFAAYLNIGTIILN